MQDYNKGETDKQAINGFQYLVDNAFFQKAYKWFENCDEQYISVCWNGVYYPVCNFYLAKFLISKSVEVYPNGHVINGTDYLEHFVEGYISGESYFKEKWPLKLFHGEHADKFVNSLHRKYFHEPNQIFEGENGWIAAAHRIPYIINYTAVKYYGFFSALVIGYDHIHNDYKELFEGLLKCDFTRLEQEEFNSDSGPKNNLQERMPFNGMMRSKIEEWFMQLADNKSTNGKPFLTRDQVHQFINRAFTGNTDLPKLTFNMAAGERTSITKLFYQYYLACTNDFVTEPTKHCKEKYVRLLTDNFTNYKYESVFDNFNNSRNAPMNWNNTV